MKLSKELTTVTPFSKYLAMLLFILFPFVGFYLGMEFQQMITISQPKQTHQVVNNLPTPTSSINITSWKTYTDQSGMFSLQYPSGWNVTLMHIGNENDKNDIRFTGKEGKIDIIWARTYGGACPPAYEKLQLKNETVNVCHEIRSNIEYWGQISKQLPLPNDPSLGVEVNAQTNAQYTLNRVTILQILSTINFFDNNKIANTNDWDLYTSVDGKISFKYPVNASIHVNQVHEFETNQYQPSSNTIEMDTPDAHATPFILIQYYKQQNKITLTDFINLQKSCVDITANGGKSMKVGGMDAKFYQTTCGPAGYDIVFVQSGEISYSITINGDYDKSFFNTFLSSIVFVQ